MFERFRAFFTPPKNYNPPDGLFFFENPGKVPDTKKRINPLETLRSSLSDPDKRQFALEKLSLIALGGNKEARTIISDIDSHGLPALVQRTPKYSPMVSYRSSRPKKGEIPDHNL